VPHIKSCGLTASSAGSRVLRCPTIVDWSGHNQEIVMTKKLVASVFACSMLAWGCGAINDPSTPSVDETDQAVNCSTPCTVGPMQNNIKVSVSSGTNTAQAFLNGAGPVNTQVISQGGSYCFERDTSSQSLRVVITGTGTFTFNWPCP
jgi:hypothetical protein